MATKTECVEVCDSKGAINFDLLGYQVEVVGSQMTEDGWLLVLEGDASELDALVLYWQDAEVLHVDEVMACS